MIRFILIIFSCFLIINTAVAEKPSVYDLSIQVAKKEYYPNEIITMDIKVKNTSQNNLKIQSIMEPQDYWLKLKVTHNNLDLKYIGPEKKLKNLGVLSTVRPGYYYGKVITLNDYFQIKEPGRYTVQATYGIGPDLLEIKQGKCTKSLNFRIKQKTSTIEECLSIANYHKRANCIGNIIIGSANKNRRMVIKSAFDF